MSEFDHISKNCASCGLLDFLSIKCSRCTLHFCRDHHLHHACSAVVVVTVSVSSETSIKKQTKCMNGCRTVLTLSNSADCSYCGEKICLKCQFDHSSKCIPYLKKLEEEKQVIASGLAEENSRFHGAIIMSLTKGNEHIIREKKVVKSRSSGITLERWERHQKDILDQERVSAACIAEFEKQITQSIANISVFQKSKMLLEKRHQSGELIENYDTHIAVLSKKISLLQTQHDDLMRRFEIQKIKHNGNVRNVEMVGSRVAEEKKKIDDDIRFLEKCDSLMSIISKYIDIISKIEPSSMHAKRREKLLTDFSTETTDMPVKTFVRFG